MSVPLMNYWSISSISLTKEAQKLGLEVEIVSKNKNLFYIKGKGKEILFKSVDYGGNSALGLKIANDKELTYKVLDRHNLPIAKTWYILPEEINTLKTLNIDFPVIIKPLEEGHGNGVMMNILSLDELGEKLKLSFKKYSKMIIQRQAVGDEHRVVVSKGEVIMAITRMPAHVIGDGNSTIEELINLENSSNKLRGEGYSSILSSIIIDDELISFIQKKGLSIKSVVNNGDKVEVRGTSNIGCGGTAIDILDTISKDIKKTAIDAADCLGLEFAGIDIITSDITKTMKEGNGIILEANATPGLGNFDHFTKISASNRLLEGLFFEN